LSRFSTPWSFYFFPCAPSDDRTHRTLLPPLRFRVAYRGPARRIFSFNSAPDWSSDGGFFSPPLGPALITSPLFHGFILLAAHRQPCHLILPAPQPYGLALLKPDFPSSTDVWFAARPGSYYRRAPLVPPRKYRPVVVHAGNVFSTPPFARCYFPLLISLMGSPPAVILAFHPPPASYPVTG